MKEQLKDQEISIDNLLPKALNKFLLSNAAAGRAKQIVEGSLPYVHHFDPNNPVVTALREIAADKVRIRVLSGPSKKPQEILARKEEDEAPSAMERLARGAKTKEKKQKKKK